MPALPSEFTRIPIAHRGLHADDVPENSLAAAQAAIRAGYGIELDVQPSSDGVPMVFHDYSLKRLVGEAGMVASQTAEILVGKRLAGSDQPIPTLAQFLDFVSGKVPLLIEIKDQDGRLGPAIGDLHRHVADALAEYQGPVAVMSFNPHVVKAFHEIAPDVPVGIVSCGFPSEDWPQLDPDRRADLAALLDFDTSGASFISHDWKDLTNPRVDALRAQAVPVLCWTVRSPDDEAKARRIADNITFEGYQASLPA